MNYGELSYLLDTDWVVYYLRNSNEAVVKLTKEYLPQGLGISIITLAELYAGVYSAKNVSKAQGVLEDFLTEVTVVDFTSEVAERYGQEYARLRKIGKLIDPFDLAIGATCLEYGLSLLTRNRRHFERLEGLTVISGE